MLSRTPTKPCRFCGSLQHFPYKCKLNPKGYKRLKRIGKTTKQWQVTRATWIKKHPSTHEGYWECYLQIHPYCPKFLTIDTLTLDHVIARSKNKKIMFTDNNLQPACEYCNTMKGSKLLDKVK